jgi:hypothetical protein
MTSHRDTGFFTESLATRDPELYGSITNELGRQRDEKHRLPCRDGSPRLGDDQQIR